MPPIDIRALYAAALGSGSGADNMGGAAGNAVPSPPILPRTPEDKDPRSQQGDTFFIDPALLHEEHKCRKGDEIMVKARVQSVGSKIALTPLEVSYDNMKEDEDEDYDGTSETPSKELAEHEMPGLHNEPRN